MKTKYLFTLITAVMLFTSGCIKNEPRIFTESLAEFDATSFNANSIGVSGALNYPIVGRNPGYGRVQNATDSTIRRFAQTLMIRINIIGPQSAKEETVGYEEFSSPIISFSFPATATCSASNSPTVCPTGYTQTPAAVAATLSIATAIPGIDYAPLSGVVTIPANSSFGFLEVRILPTAAMPGAGRFIGLKLNNSGTLKVSPNYSELGLVIDKR